MSKGISDVQIEEAFRNIEINLYLYNLNTCKNFKKRELDALSDTTSSFFHFVQAFGNKLKLRDFVNIWMVKNRVQDLNSVTRGVFQIYFYDNLFIWINKDEF